jgi:hypothetical protein
MGLKDRVVGKLERALLSTAISVLVFFVERKLKRAFRARESRLDTKKRVA